MRSTLRLSNSSNGNNSIIDKKEVQNQSKTLPTYAIAIIVLSCVIILVVFLYLYCHKNKKNNISKNIKTKYRGPIHEVWANPNIDICLNELYSNELY
jgi:hypothetical protein